MTTYDRLDIKIQILTTPYDKDWLMIDIDAPMDLKVVLSKALSEHYRKQSKGFKQNHLI